MVVKDSSRQRRDRSPTNTSVVSRKSNFDIESLKSTQKYVKNLSKKYLTQTQNQEKEKEYVKPRNNFLRNQRDNNVDTSQQSLDQSKVKSTTHSPSPTREQVTSNLYPSPTMKSTSVTSPNSKPPKMLKNNSALCDTANRSKGEFGYNQLSASHLRNNSNSRKEWDDNGQEKKWVNFYQENVSYNSQIQIMNMQESPKAKP